MYQRKFHTSKTCLSIDVSERGIFFVIAPVDDSGIKLNGKAPFKWAEAITCKMSVEELIELNYVLKVFWGFEQYRVQIEGSSDFLNLIGIDAYNELVKSRFPSRFDKTGKLIKEYKNYLFFHSYTKSEETSSTQMGFFLYEDRLAFSAFKASQKLYLPITQFSALAISKYFDWVINLSYSYGFYKKTDEGSIVNLDGSNEMEGF